MSTSTHRIVLWGDVDLYRKAELQELVREFQDSESKSVSVFMGEVTFVDSVGLAFLVELRGVAQTLGGTVQVVDASESVLRLLRLVDVAGTFVVTRTDSTDLSALDVPAETYAAG